MKHKTLFIAAALVAGSVSASDKTWVYQQSGQLPASAAHQDFKLPIQFDYAQPKNIQVGDTVTVEVTITAQASADNLSVDVSQSRTLQSSQSGQRILNTGPIQTGQQRIFSIDVKPLAAGRQTLGMILRMQRNGKEALASYGIAVDTQGISQKSSSRPTTTLANGETVRLLPAKTRVITNQP